MISDPVEQLVADGLTAAGVEWRTKDDPARRRDPVTLDFEIVGGPHIEVKRFASPRSAGQLAQAENVILIQGIDAARWFAAAIAPARP